MIFVLRAQGQGRGGRQHGLAKGGLPWAQATGEQRTAAALTAHLVSLMKSATCARAPRTDGRSAPSRARKARDALVEEHSVESTGLPVLYRYFTGTIPVRVDQISSTVRVNTGWTGIGPVCAPRDKVFDVRG